jgi:hypothetical protein
LILCGTLFGRLTGWPAENAETITTHSPWPATTPETIVPNRAPIPTFEEYKKLNDKRLGEMKRGLDDE